MREMIKSKLSKKNITIIRSFIVISTISVLATLVIGISSFITINGAQKNVKLMYENCLQRQVLLSSINVKLNNLRNDTSAQIDYPKDSYKENINKALEDIDTHWDQYKSLDCTGDNEIMNNLIEELLLGLERSCNNITKIKNNEYLDDKVKDMYKANFHEYDYSISITVSEATLKNKVDAEKLFNQINKAYVNSIIIFIVLFIISIISIFLVATVLIKLLKKSIRSFTDILDTLTKGDLTVDINTDEKSEIGIMKKNLAVTISSISHIFKLIKTSSELTLEKSKSLAEVSKEMDSTMWEVTNEICGITEGAAVQANKLIVINSTFSKLGYKIENLGIKIEEIKKLSEQSKNSSNEINNIVEEINNDKNYINKKIEATTSIAKENSDSSEKISNSIQVVTLLADGLAKTSQLLEDDSNHLLKQVNNFKLEEDII